MLVCNLMMVRFIQSQSTTDDTNIVLFFDTFKFAGMF